MRTQKERVLSLLQRNKKSGVSCMRFAMIEGILRYGAWIHLLRKEGHIIEMEDKRVKKNGHRQRQTTYRLV